MVRVSAAGTPHIRRVVLISASQKPHLEQEGPDISRLALHLQQQWDFQANMHLGNIVITPHSNRKVRWLCELCPDGHPHIWMATVDSRSYGSGCPQCSGRKVCQHNSLATKAPQVAAKWDYAKNSCTPSDVTAFCHNKAHWHCHVCGHDWEARVDRVVQFNSGCPRCNAGGMPKADGSKPRTEHPTFAECQHSLLSQWDHERNAAEDILPSNTRLRSHKRVHWLCHQCPAGQPHRWVQTPNLRLDKSGRERRGCPVCAGQVACKCNSLQTHNPAVAAEWNYDLNDGGPDDYTASSHAKAWWRSPERGIWQGSIRSRTTAENKRKARADGGQH